jgi:hypothetical protein
LRYDYSSHPIPHLFIDQIVRPDVYERLRFPDNLINADDAWGITTSDRKYQEILEDPAWRALHDELRGAAFVADVLGAFAADMRREGCLVDVERARLVSFVESRDEKEASVLEDGADPNEVYTRLDFQCKGHGEYREFVHLDWARRIVGGILFFSDADEEGLEGGELALYRDRRYGNDRWCHEPELACEFRPRHNTGVIFLNSNSGFHGPRAIRQLSGHRRWLYFTISSKVDVWPCTARA